MIVRIHPIRACRCLIHESDLTPGLATKIASRFAKVICVSFEKTKQYFKNKKTYATGLPIRTELLKGDKSRARDFLKFDNKPVLLIMGGSLGAEKLNQIVRNSLPKLLANFNIIHLCGKNKIDEQYNNLENYRQVEYAGDVLSDFFALCDIIVSRAGANAIEEIRALSKPNVLIPLSRAASRGDQIENADYFKKQGWSEVLAEEKLTPEILEQMVSDLYDKRQIWQTKMEQSKSYEPIEKIIKIITGLDNLKLNDKVIEEY